MLVIPTIGFPNVMTFHLDNGTTHAYPDDVVRIQKQPKPNNVRKKCRRQPSNTSYDPHCYHGIAFAAQSLRSAGEGGTTGSVAAIASAVADALATLGIRVTSDGPFTPPALLTLIKSGGKAIAA